MRVVLVLSPLAGLHERRGAGRYTKYLVEALRNLRDGNEYLVTSRPWAYHPDVVHYPFFDFYFLTMSSKNLATTVVTVHDTIPLVFPREYPAGLRGKIKFLVQRRLLSRAKAIITDSVSSQKDIVRYLGQTREKITVVPLAAPSQFRQASRMDQDRVRRKYDLPKKYLLYIGDINYNKNLVGLITSLSKIREATLVIVSQALYTKDTSEAEVIYQTIEKEDLSERVRVIRVAVEATKDVAAIYSAAWWYVQPSVYEGFGLPVLEAMVCGTPVICARAASLPEVAGEAALYFDPHNSTSLSQVIATVMRVTDRKRKADVEAGYRQARQFSWRKTAILTRSVYQKVCVL